MDQVASPQNINRYVRYISDLKIIVVDRDPRDVYLNDVVINRDCVLPVDIKQFCKVYKISRKKRETENESNSVLEINFEDMIYDYERTTNRIMRFLGLSEKNHAYKQKYFIPDVSKKNTRIWERSEEYKKIAKEIAECLPEFLYSYSEL